ncbi:putative reverse transcriptase domain-containing protein [Tanacetum coccineum]
MAPKRALRSTPVTENPTTTTVTNAQLQGMIDQGVTASLTARDANRNGDDSHTSGTGYSNCTVACQVKFMTCTLQENALTWWNSYVKTTTPEVAHAMPWKMLKKMMTDKYCPRGEIKKIEFEMWNLKVKGTDVFATELMDKKISTLAERQAENKRKLDNNNQTQQQLSKRQNVAQAYAAGTGERKDYVGTLPLCNK